MRRTQELSQLTDRAVQDGDEVILDFEGFVDGEAFEGGKGENYPLTIGSGSFIPGFEEQLIGAEARKRSRSKSNIPGRLPCRRAERKRSCIQMHSTRDQSKRASGDR